MPKAKMRDMRRLDRVMIPIWIIPGGPTYHYLEKFGHQFGLNEPLDPFLHIALQGYAM